MFTHDYTPTNYWVYHVAKMNQIIIAFCSLLEKKIKMEFKKTASDLLAGRLMLYGDFMDLTSDERKYLEITDREDVHCKYNTVTRSSILFLHLSFYIIYYEGIRQSHNFG